MTAFAPDEINRLWLGISTLRPDFSNDGLLWVAVAICAATFKAY